MTFSEFKRLVELYTQDSQAKMPVKFEEWQTLIQRSIINLSNKITIDEFVIDVGIPSGVLRYLVFNDNEKVSIKKPEKIEDEKAEVNINDQLVLAVIFDIAEVLTRDLNIKQKLILEREEVMNNYVWNKFTSKEASK